MQTSSLAEMNLLFLGCGIFMMSEMEGIIESLVDMVDNKDSHKE